MIRFLLLLPITVSVFSSTYCYSQAVKEKKSHNLELALLNPEEITELNLNGSQDYKTLPPEIGKLKNLKILKMYGCGLRAVSPEIGNLKNLEVIDLGGNYLKTLPPEFCNITKLHELNLAGNELENLPEEMGNLQNLVSLDLSKNKLTVLPLSFYMLSRLAVLDLTMNQLQFLSPQSKDLVGLEVLNLSKNNLEYIPDKLWFAPRLYSLNLYKCGAMLSFPKDFCDIPSSEIKPRTALIDTWHAPASMTVPICTFGNNGMRKGWAIVRSD